MKHKMQSLLLVLFLFSINHWGLNAQVLCNLESGVVEHSTTVDEEYSGLAYSPINDVFLMPMDSPLGGFHIKGYSPNTNQSFNVSINGLLDNDLEGLTYLEDNYFALIEEDNNELYFYQYNHADAELILKNSISLLDNIPISTNTGDGIEGITYDPHSNRLFFVLEHYPRELFSITVLLPTNSDDGEISGDFSSIELPNMYFNDPFYPTDPPGSCEKSHNDASGLHHLGQNFDVNSPFANHLLILSEGNRKVIEFEILFDASGNIILNYKEEYAINNSLMPDGTSLEIAQPEGITVIGNEMYIASEKGCGSRASLSSYQIDFPEVNLKVMLGGAAYIANSLGGSLYTNTMRTDLYEREVLPGMQFTAGQIGVQTPEGQPYNIGPWNYQGQEGMGFNNANYANTVVDWILVSFRTNALNVGTTVLKTAALVHNDGQVEFLNNDLELCPNQDYFIVVEHRNHLPVMSHVAVEAINGVLTYDFTTQDSWKTPTKSGQKEIAPGLWAMFGGNGDQLNSSQKRDINGSDKGFWLESNGVFSIYTNSDYNLSAETTGNDKHLWSSNNGITTIIE